MMKGSRGVGGVWPVLVLAGMVPGLGRAQEPQTALGRQLARIDLGVSGAGQFTSNSSGTNYLNQPVTLAPSNTVGALVQVRYTRSPFVGGEFNYSYARYTEDFRYTAPTATGTAAIVLGVQTNVSEYSLGYLVHTPKQYFGVQPFAAVGAGSTAFRPTRNGGQGYKPQARATYYYTVGVEQSVFNPHFGLRAQFRQAFFLAPDYETNYLTIKQRAVNTEPSFGFYLHF